MNKLIIFTTICLLISLNSIAQDTHKIDSLQNQIKKYETYKQQLGQKDTSLMDSTKADLLTNIGLEYAGSEPMHAITYAKQSFDLSVKIGYKKGMAYSYTVNASVNFNITDYLHSLEYYEKAREIYKEIGEHELEKEMNAKIDKVKAKLNK